MIYFLYMLEWCKKTPWILYKQCWNMQEFWWIECKKTYILKIQLICWHYLVNFYKCKGTNNKNTADSVILWDFTSSCTTLTSSDFFISVVPRWDLKRLCFVCEVAIRAMHTLFFLTHLVLLRSFFIKIPIALFAERNKFLSLRSLFFVR